MLLSSNAGRPALATEALARGVDSKSQNVYHGSKRRAAFWHAQLLRPLRRQLSCPVSAMMHETSRDQPSTAHPAYGVSPRGCRASARAAAWRTASPPPARVGDCASLRQHCNTAPESPLFQPCGCERHPRAPSLRSPTPSPRPSAPLPRRGVPSPAGARWPLRDKQREHLRKRLVSSAPRVWHATSSLTPQQHRPPRTSPASH